MFFGRRMPTVGRRLCADWNRPLKALTRRASASADAKDFPGRRRPTVGRRPPEAEFIRHACRPPAEGSAPIAIGLFRHCAPGVGPADAKGFLGRRRPTIGRRPPEAESIRHAGQPSAEGSAPIEIGLFRRW